MTAHQGTLARLVMIASMMLGGAMLIAITGRLAASDQNFLIYAFILPVLLVSAALNVSALVQGQDE